MLTRAAIARRYKDLNRFAGSIVRLTVAMVARRWTLPFASVVEWNAVYNAMAFKIAAILSRNLSRRTFAGQLPEELPNCLDHRRHCDTIVTYHYFGIISS